MKKIKLFFIAFMAFIFTFSAVPGDFSSAQAWQVKYVKKLSITAGQKYKLYVKGTQKKIKWKSENRCIAKVSSVGTVKAQKKGITYVTAKIGACDYKTKVIVKAARKRTARKATIICFGGNGTVNIAGNVSDVKASFAQAVKDMKSSVNLEVNDSGTVKNSKQFFSELMTYVRRNDEYSYFTLRGYSYSYSNDGNVLKATVKLLYNITPEEKNASDQKAAQIVRSMKLKGTSEQKAIKLCQKLSDIEYRTDVATAYNALNEGIACCQGFSTAYYLLCKKAGIQCHILTGVAKTDAGSECHMWNAVKIESKWKAIDTTWNAGSPEKPYLSADAKLRSRYRDADSIFLCRS